MTDHREFAAFLRRLRTLAVVLVAIIALGTLGLMATEGVGAWRGFIWTLDILATVGSIPAPDTVGARYVVVDHNPEMREHAQGIGVRFIEGEPSDDEVLRAAGVMRARGVIACVDSDADNIFITLTVRGLRPDIAIVARASEEAVEAKLHRAGATRVISPYKTSGSEMARLALNPQIRGAPQVAPSYRMEEIEVAAGSAGEGQPIGDVRGGAIIVGVRDRSGQFQPQPSSETILQAGDVVMAIGTERTMERLEELFAPAGTRARS